MSDKVKGKEAKGGDKKPAAEGAAKEKGGDEKKGKGGKKGKGK